MLVVETVNNDDPNPLLSFSGLVFHLETTGVGILWLHDTTW